MVPSTLMRIPCRFRNRFMMFPCGYKSFETATSGLTRVVRTLKPGSRLIIVDAEHKDQEYKSTLQELELKDVELKLAGFNGWWNGPWMSSYIIQGVKA